MYGKRVCLEKLGETPIELYWLMLHCIRDFFWKHPYFLRMNCQNYIVLILSYLDIVI